MCYSGRVAVEFRGGEARELGKSSAGRAASDAYGHECNARRLEVVQVRHHALGQLEGIKVREVREEERDYFLFRQRRQCVRECHSALVVCSITWHYWRRQENVKRSRRCRCCCC